MPNQEIDDFTALGAAPAAGDLIPMVDVSDTTDSPQGTTKKMTVTNLLAAVPSGGPATQIDETGGPTTLDIAGIADGEYLRRSGTDIIGDTPSVGGPFPGADFDKYRLMGVSARPNSTNTDTYGHSAVTPFADSSANTDDASGPFIRRNTTTSSGNSAGLTFNNGALIWIDWLPQLYTKLKTFTDITSTRIWIGSFSGSPSGSDDPALDAIAFRYSTAAGDTTWKAYTHGASASTITDTGVTVSLSTVYLLAIVVESTSSVKFYISTNNGVSFSLVATHTTNLPSGAIGDYYFQVETLTTAARGLSHSFTHIRMR